MNDTQPLGEVVRDGERVGVRYVRTLRHTPEKVWRALTESEHLRRWLPCDLVGERREGAELIARFWPDFVQKYGMQDADIPARIQVFQPPALFEWLWGDDVLRFELEAVDVGTRLTFTTWLGSAPVPPHKTAAGWHACLDRLPCSVGNEPIEVPLLNAAVEELEQRYASLFS